MRGTIVLLVRVVPMHINFSSGTCRGIRREGSRRGAQQIFRPDTAAPLRSFAIAPQMYGYAARFLMKKLTSAFSQTYIYSPYTKDLPMK